jgi:hypothetical protein
MFKHVDARLWVLAYGRVWACVVGCVWQMAAIKQALDSKVDRDTVRRMLQEREALGPASGSGSASPQ